MMLFSPKITNLGPLKPAPKTGGKSNRSQTSGSLSGHNRLYLSQFWAKTEREKIGSRSKLNRMVILSSTLAGPLYNVFLNHLVKITSELVMFTGKMVECYTVINTNEKFNFGQELLYERCLKIVFLNYKSISRIKET
jgi:hypothetical protein